MVNLPYGGMNFEKPFIDDNPWVNLKTILEHLEDGEVIPPDLARWLGEAIKYSNEDSTELLRRLGLTKGQGRPSKSGNAWLIWGERICELEDQFGSAEQAINTALEELEDEYSRSQLQKWRDKYRRAKNHK